MKVVCPIIIEIGLVMVNYATNANNAAVSAAFPGLTKLGGWNIT